MDINFVTNSIVKQFNSIPSIPFEQQTGLMQEIITELSDAICKSFYWKYKTCDVVKLHIEQLLAIGRSPQQLVIPASASFLSFECLDQTIQQS